MLCPSQDIRRELGWFLHQSTYWTYFPKSPTKIPSSATAAALSPALCCTGRGVGQKWSFFHVHSLYCKLAITVNLVGKLLAWIGQEQLWPIFLWTGCFALWAHSWQSSKSVPCFDLGYSVAADCLFCPSWNFVGEKNTTLYPHVKKRIY